MNVIDGQAGLVIYSSLIFYSLTIDNILNIIVLLILAGVTIATLMGDNGILTRANESKIEQTHGAVREGMTLAYNEYQIEINTATNGELASTKKVRIQGKEEKVLSTTNKTFLQFLNDKGYIKEGTTNILNYYDKNNKKEEIWNVNDKNNSMGGLELEADTGKEELILVYEVKEGENAKLPFCLQWRDEFGDDETVYNAIYDFHVNRGDGIESDITNENIKSLAIHEYNKNGTYEVKITGSYDILGEAAYINNLIKVKQWGTTGLKIVDCGGMDGLTEIVSPTENSFKELKHITFDDTNLGSIPENLFKNCQKVESFERCFMKCYNLTDKASELWLRVPNGKENEYIGIPDGRSCFAYCENLSDFEQIPDYWKQEVPTKYFQKFPIVT